MSTARSSAARSRWPPRPVEAGQRIFEDLVGDRAKAIPVGNHRMGRGPAERQALGEAELELLKARERQPRHKSG